MESKSQKSDSPKRKKPKENNPSKTDADVSPPAKKLATPKPDIASHPRKVKFKTRGLEIIKHEQLMAAHGPHSKEDITISGIVHKALTNLELKTAAAPTLRFALFDGGEFARIIAALDTSWATLNKFRNDVLNIDVIKVVGTKHSQNLVRKAEEALESLIDHNMQIARMGLSVRELSAEDHSLLVDLINDFDYQARQPVTDEIMRKKLLLAARLIKTFVVKP